MLGNLGDLGTLSYQDIISGVTSGLITQQDRINLEKGTVDILVPYPYVAKDERLSAETMEQVVLAHSYATGQTLHPSVLATHQQYPILPDNYEQDSLINQYESQATDWLNSTSQSINNWWDSIVNDYKQGQSITEIESNRRSTQMIWGMAIVAVGGLWWISKKASNFN